MTDTRNAALQPLADIADAFENDGLDGVRPSWGDTRESAGQRELYQGRGGKTLLTLEQCFAARDALRAAGGWRPIECAPSEKWLLTHRADEKTWNVCWLSADRTEWSDQMGRTTITHHSFAPPTHWFDIPELIA